MTSRDRGRPNVAIYRESAIAGAFAADPDPRLQRIRTLRGAGAYLGLGAERIRQLTRSDPYFPKSIPVGKAGVSWSVAQLEAYRGLRAARELRRKLARERIDRFHAEEPGEPLGKDEDRLVTQDGAYAIEPHWHIYFRGEHVATVLDSLVDARITLGQLREQDLDWGASELELAEMASFLASPSVGADPEPEWMWRHAGRAVGEDLPLAGSDGGPWGVVYLPEIVEVFAVRTKGGGQLRDRRNTIFLSDLPSGLDRDQVHGMLCDLCESAPARDPDVGLTFLKKSLEIYFPKTGEHPGAGAYLDPVADVAWIPFDVTSVPLASKETEWGLIDFPGGWSGDSEQPPPRSIEVRGASLRLPADLRTRLVATRSSVMA
jgi:hypothetical protein